MKHSKWLLHMSDGSHMVFTDMRYRKIQDDDTNILRFKDRFSNNDLFIPLTSVIYYERQEDIFIKSDDDYLPFPEAGDENE